MDAERFSLERAVLHLKEQCAGNIHPYKVWCHNPNSSRHEDGVARGSRVTKRWANVRAVRCNDIYISLYVHEIPLLCRTSCAQPGGAV